jgi:hypothetical protein
MLTPLYPITTDAATITVVASGALAGETSVPIDPLTIELASGTMLDFGTSHYAKIAADAAIDDETLTVEALPLDLAPGLTAEVPGSPASAILSETFTGYSAEKRLAYELVAQGLLGLRAGYTGDDAEWLSFAQVLQVNYLVDRGDEPLVKKAITQGGTAVSTTFRDRYLNPDAAAIVARVTGIQQVRFTPPPAGV